MFDPEKSSTFSTGLDLPAAMIRYIAPPNDPATSTGEAILVTVDLPTLKRWLQSGSRQDQSPARLLTSKEHHYYAGLRLAKRRLEWLGGRLAAKAALTAMGRQHSAPQTPRWLDWEILPDATGRPALTRVAAGPLSPRPPVFSISHSGQRALALAAGGCPACGCDIQLICDTITAIRRRFISDSELQLFRWPSVMATLDTTQRLTLVWAAKEAIRKAFHCRPLPGFLEVCFTSCAPAGNGVTLTGSFRRHDQQSSVRAFAWLDNDYALAITLMASPRQTPTHTS